VLQALHTIEAAPRGAAGDAALRIGSSLDVQDVVGRYGRAVILDKLSLSIRPGEFLTLLGPSGSGKSTLLAMIAGFMPVDEGRILVDGKPVQDVPAHKRGFGMVFQNYALFPHMTVTQNVAFPMHMAGVDRPSISRRVDEVLQILRLGDHAHKLPTQLSGGQQQRVAIGRAIALRPRVVLMDEPLSALDRRLRESTLVEIRELHRQLGMTIVFVTHDQGEALALSDRIAVLDAGRIVQLGTPAQLYREPANHFVAKFVGESNLLDVEVIERRGELARVRDAAGFEFEAGVATPSIGRGPAKLLVRPERVSLVSPQTPGALPAHVTDAVFLGEILRVDLRLASGAHLQMRTLDGAHARVPSIGDEVHVAWAQADTWVLA
jgi:putative spermidine/putrescine transport system ATP-binding protein